MKGRSVSKNAGGNVGTVSTAGQFETAYLPQTADAAAAALPLVASESSEGL